MTIFQNIETNMVHTKKGIHKHYVDYEEVIQFNR